MLNPETLQLEMVWIQTISGHQTIHIIHILQSNCHDKKHTHCRSQAAEILRSLGLRRFGVPQQLPLVVIPGIVRVTRGGLAGGGGPAPCSKPCHVPLYRWVYRGSLNGFWYSPMYNINIYIYIHTCTRNALQRRGFPFPNKRWCNFTKFLWEKQQRY